MNKQRRQELSDTCPFYDTESNKPCCIEPTKSKCNCEDYCNCSDYLEISAEIGDSLQLAIDKWEDEHGYSITLGAGEK